MSDLDLKRLNGSLAQSFGRIAQDHPKRTAITCVGRGESKSVTFAELANDVAKARAALEATVPAGAVVVTRSLNSYNHLVTVLAVMFSNRILCPVNPSEPSAQFDRRLAQIPSPFLFDVNSWIHHQAAAPADTPDRTREDRVYIFTSGSTGESKIVRQTEAMILSNVEALLRHHDIRPGMVIATPLPLFHVNALEFSLLCSVLSGAHLILFDGFSPAQWATLLVKQRVDIASLIPPMIGILTETFTRENLRPDIGYVVSAATALPQSVAREFYDRFGIRINQGYGLSEAVNFSCVMPIGISAADYEQIMFSDRFPSIGIPIWGNSVQVLANGRECGEREVGEIHIRGLNVMPGYLNAKEQTAHLNTGDLGYFVCHKGDRYFYISGRAKDCIKRFGETVPLREVDDAAVFARIAGLDCISVPFANDHTGEEVGMVCQTRGEVDPFWRQKLLDCLSQNLSVAMRPKLLLVTDNEIRTASGKPIRWKFIPRFAQFRSQFVGTEPSWID